MPYVDSTRNLRTESLAWLWTANVPRGYPRRYHKPAIFLDRAIFINQKIVIASDSHSEVSCSLRGSSSITRLTIFFILCNHFIYSRILRFPGCFVPTARPLANATRFDSNFVSFSSAILCGTIGRRHYSDKPIFGAPYHPKSERQRDCLKKCTPLLVDC